MKRALFVLPVLFLLAVPAKADIATDAFMAQIKATCVDVWCPVIAAVPYKKGVVFQVTDWTGSGDLGEKPPIGKYIGPDGNLVDTPAEANAIDKKGVLAVVQDVLTAIQDALNSE